MKLKFFPIFDPNLASWDKSARPTAASAATQLTGTEITGAVWHSVVKWTLRPAAALRPS